MSLITCPECDKRVSDHAATCPHCGYPLIEKLPSNTASTPANTSTPQERASRRSSPGRILLIIGLGIFAYFYLLFDTSVPVYSDPISALRGGVGSSRVNNLGLMQDRTLGCVAGIAIAVIGTIMLLSERHKKV